MKTTQFVQSLLSLIMNTQMGGWDSSSFFFNITFQKQQLNVCLEQMYGYKFVCRDQRNV